MKKQKPTKKLANLAIAFALVLTLFTFTFAPASVSAQGDSFSTISVGRNHTMAIKSDSSLWTWQRNFVVNGMAEDRCTPVKLIDEVVQVSAGDGHWVAIKSDGSLWVWGSNIAWT